MANRMKHYDQVDYQILKKLSQNARASAAEIAKTININERTIRRRLKNLLETNTIRVTAVINPSMFGYDAIADINLKVESEIFDEFVEVCKNNPNICYIATGWGEANLALQCRFLNNEELYEYINSTLPQTKGVEVLHYFIIPQIISNIDCWLPIASDFQE